MAGVDLRAVAESMSHKTIQMTAAVERLAEGWQLNEATATKTDTSAVEQGGEVAPVTN
jgi:hypothetical protein